MSKRKKKGKKRKVRSTPTSWPYGAADQSETAPLYQKVFRESDMMRLAGEYRRRSESEPSLTLEAFADQYGISPNEIRAYVPELNDEADNSVLLWHGTTRSRADSILLDGFDGKRRGGVFFARSTKIPRSTAQRRASSEHDQPVVIMCSVDLEQYDNYKQVGRGVYVFHHERMGQEVVKEVLDARAGKIRVKPEKVELTNVAITFNSGRAGIAFWINNYLMLEGQNKIGEDHEAVGKIKECLDDQADAGRFGEVSDEEMLVLIRRYLPEYLS